MALLDSELARIRSELGYNVMGVQAEPYIGVTAIFNTVIQQYITSGAKTTSATPVSAASAPTPQTLTLASAVGFSAGDVMVVDVDSRQEKATIQAVSGSTVTALLSLAHAGTYPVTVEGGESIVREVLGHLTTLGALGMGGVAGAMAKVQKRAGIKKADEVEFFGGGSGGMVTGKDPVSLMIQLREYWRDELANTLGVARLNARSGGVGLSAY